MPLFKIFAVDFLTHALCVQRQGMSSLERGDEIASALETASADVLPHGFYI